MKYIICQGKNNSLPSWSWYFCEQDRQWPKKIILKLKSYDMLKEESKWDWRDNSTEIIKKFGSCKIIRNEVKRKVNHMRT